MGKPTIADLSSEMEIIDKRLAALEIRLDTLETDADPEAFEDALPLDAEEQAALAFAEGERHAAIGATLALIEVEIHGDVAALLMQLDAAHGLQSDTGDGWHTVEMHDIEAMGRGDIRLALRNWCNAARRALAEAA